MNGVLVRAKAYDGLATPGVSREVVEEGMDHPMYAVTYTVPEAAAAFQMSILGFKRWIKEGLIPPPVLREPVRGYRLYSRGELAAIMREVTVHMRECAYFATSHSVTIERVWQAVQAYRSTGI